MGGRRRREPRDKAKSFGSAVDAAETEGLGTAAAAAQSAVNLSKISGSVIASYNTTINSQSYHFSRSQSNRFQTLKLYLSRASDSLIGPYKPLQAIRRIPTTNIPPWASQPVSYVQI